MTIITIAHRLTTIRHSEQIAVVNKGVIVEHGTWEELMLVEGGIFKRGGPRRIGDCNAAQTSDIAADARGGILVSRKQRG